MAPPILSEVITLGPGTAAEVLAMNLARRPVDEKIVDYYVGLMASGGWEPGESNGVTFGEHGQLIAGRRVFEAIVRYGKHIAVHMTVNVPTEQIEPHLRIAADLSVPQLVEALRANAGASGGEVRNVEMFIAHSQWVADLATRKHIKLVWDAEAERHVASIDWDALPQRPLNQGQLAAEFAAMREKFAQDEDGDPEFQERRAEAERLVQQARDLLGKGRDPEASKSEVFWLDQTLSLLDESLTLIRARLADEYPPPGILLKPVNDPMLPLDTEKTPATEVLARAWAGDPTALPEPDGFVGDMAVWGDYGPWYVTVGRDRIIYVQYVGAHIGHRVADLLAVRMIAAAQYARRLGGEQTERKGWKDPRQPS